MDIFKIVLMVMQVIAALGLTLIITLQSGKESGLGALAGNSDSYMGKNKGATLDKKLAAATKWIALAWVVITLALVLVIA